MLAAYPEVFAGGAIIAGLPYGCATTIPQAFDRMRGHGLPTETELAGLVRRASDHAGSWPTISIWHGTGDATVDLTNADAIIDQWRALHGVGPKPSRVEAVDGYPHRVWCDGQGREVIEEYRITGMSHGTPLNTAGPEGCGTSGPFMLDVGISSTQRICRFWGLAEGDVSTGRQAVAPASAASNAPPASRPHEEPRTPAAAAGVGKVIEDALRAAGLMR
jgi:poly(3-hydroxybutyrate) depolymerase